ncbi:ras GTPase-activating protein raskol [Chrysoperla carnea]|uniref:ras GTPase-activating protein raskol n=1 Tax=Chrysoperla carnea TaxID=189513 RepID=UPI001D08D368|nr:ras GTPase-activating protein raskol [Chrysoperla carnea]
MSYNRYNKIEYPCRVEGWLYLYDKSNENESSHHKNDSSAYKEIPESAWIPNFCVLLQDEQTLTAYKTEELSISDSLFVDLPRVRLDGCCGSGIGGNGTNTSGGGRCRTIRHWPETPSLPEEPENDYESKSNNHEFLASPPNGLNVSEDAVSLREEHSHASNDGSDTSYEKACRRGSAPTTPVLGGSGNSTNVNTSTNQNTSSDNITPSRILNFFAKRSFRANPLKRTKSVAKLERGKRTVLSNANTNTGSTNGSSTGSSSSRLRSSRSHESLLSGHSLITSLDLGSNPGNVEIKEVHPSVLGRPHCFQVKLSSDEHNPRYFSCQSQDERDKWIYSLRKSVQPDVEHTRRTDNSLKIWILEAKGIINKKRYFCEIYLDDTLYARTSIKYKNDLCFWGEQFDFYTLPLLSNIYIKIYRTSDDKVNKKHFKKYNNNNYIHKQILIGTVNIGIKDVASRYPIERWYPIVTTSNASNSSSNTKETTSLRVKCRFQSIDILPVKIYSEFLEYLKIDYKKVCEILEPVIGVKAKEDIATSLVLTMQSENMAHQFLADIVMMDILRVDDQRLTFRGNSLATKAMEAYLKLTGDRYLKETLSNVVCNVLASNFDCEVDPLKVMGPDQLNKQQMNLRSMVEMAWSKILQSHTNFPYELRECFALFRERLKYLDKGDISDNLISASIFLRFLCPAILSPSLFNITHEYPNEKASRNLTLIAKTLQTLANFTRFQGKENFMEFMNDFLEREAKDMKEFLKNISTRLQTSPEHNSAPTYEFDGHIDLGKQLSILSMLLTECLTKVAPTKLQELDVLIKILENLQLHQCSVGTQFIQHRPHSTVSASSVNVSTPLAHTVIPTIPQYHLNNDNSCIVEQHTNSAHHTNLFRVYDAGLKTSNINLTNASNNNMDDNRTLSVAQNHHPHPNMLSSSASSTLSLTKNNYLTVQNSSTLDNYHLHPQHYQLSLNKSPKLGVRASTLPRNNTTSSSASYNIIEPATAFISKSPTPMRVHHVQNDSPHHHHPNLDELSDLLRYADEEDVMKGSNMSISQISNVASSGYQSFTTESNSPIDLTNQGQSSMQRLKMKQMPPPLAFANPVYQRFNNNHSDDEQLKNPRPYPRTNPLITYRTIPTTTMKSNDLESKMYRRLSLESARELSDTSSDDDSTTKYHTTGRCHNNKLRLMIDTGCTGTSDNAPNTPSSKESVEHYERQIERLQASVDELRRKLERSEYGNSTPDLCVTTTTIDSDNKMKEIINRLINVEEELRREQQKMSLALSHKQRVIEAQEHQIAALDAANNRLLSALSTLKLRYNNNNNNNNNQQSTTTSSNNNNQNDNTMLTDVNTLIKSSKC